MPHDIVKGTKVRASWFQSSPFGTYSLAGAQMKLSGRMVEVFGVCRHFRGDHPDAPKEIRIYLEVDGEVPPGVTLTRPFGCSCSDHPDLVEIRPEWIREVFDAR